MVSHQVDARSSVLTRAEVTLIYFSLAVASCRKTEVRMERWLSFYDIDLTCDIWDLKRIWQLFSPSQRDAGRGEERLNCVLHSRKKLI